MFRNQTINLEIVELKKKKEGNWKWEISLDTWNFRTLFSTGAAHTVTREIGRYELKIVSIQRIKGQATEFPDINNHITFHIKCNNWRNFGTSFIVQKSIVPTIMEIKTIHYSKIIVINNKSTLVQYYLN